MNKENEKLQRQKELIYLLLHHKGLVSDFIDISIDIDHFDEKYRIIIFHITEVFKESNVLLTRKTFEDRLKSFVSYRERIEQIHHHSICYSAIAKSDDFPFLIKNIIEGSVESSINNALDRFKINSINNGERVGAKQLVDDIQEILDGTDIKNKEELFYDDIRILTKERLTYIDGVRDGSIEEEPIILTGIKEIDETMVTGLSRGTLTLFCSDVGGGKSTIMLNIGLNVWKGGSNVLFVPLEMHRYQMWNRACAREARVPTKILFGSPKNITDEQRDKIGEMYKSWNEEEAQFYIMQYPGNTSVQRIERTIKKYIDRMKPKLVVIDYVANLEPDRKRGDRNDLEIGDMLKHMRQMGKDIGFATISAAQLGREALKRIRKKGISRSKTTINSEDIRGSHEYAADADNVYAMLSNTAQPNEEVYLYVVKSRNGEKVFISSDGESSMQAILQIFPQYGLIQSASIFDTEQPDDILDNILEQTELNKDILVKKEDQEWDDIFEDVEDVEDVENIEDIIRSIDE